MNAAPIPLENLGWSSNFQRQLNPEEAVALRPARVFAIQRTHLTLMSETGALDVNLGGKWYQLDPEQRPTVGDWVLISRNADAIVRVLERKSLLKRVHPGQIGEMQLIAANVDTLFLVTSCNVDFNLRRLERYLTLAYEAGVEPVVVITKADLAEDPELYRAEARKISPDLAISLVDARKTHSIGRLRAWCARGQTVALLGSSGVGKSTLVNTLCGAAVQLTGDIRHRDDKGRHTTTHRSLHALPRGGLILDSPGMRQLAVAEVESGVRRMFGDLETLAARCRFTDCAHGAEPGCAVRSAIGAGELDQERLDSYLKLKREQADYSEGIVESRAQLREAVKLRKRDQGSTTKRR